MERRNTRPTQFRTVENEGQKKIECYFAVFDDIYQWAPNCTETIDCHAFDDTLNEDIRSLINHDTSLVLGRTAADTLTLAVDAHGLKGEVLINEQDQDALNLYARVQRGDVNQCSIGFDILEEDQSENNGVHNWHITKLRLYEVSIVTFPAYEGTEATARSSRVSELNQIWKKRTKERLENVKTTYAPKKTGDS